MTTISSLVVVFYLGFLANVTADNSCSLNCQQNATCVAGSADFTEYITAENTTLEIHNQTSSSGMYCSCPPGWTGLTCNRKYETCDELNTCYVSPQEQDTQDQIASIDSPRRVVARMVLVLTSSLLFIYAIPRITYFKI